MPHMVQARDRAGFLEIHLSIRSIFSTCGVKVSRLGTLSQDWEADGAGGAWPGVHGRKQKIREAAQAATEPDPV